MPGVNDRPFYKIFVIISTLNKRTVVGLTKQVATLLANEV